MLEELIKNWPVDLDDFNERYVKPALLNQGSKLLNAEGEFTTQGLLLGEIVGNSALGIYDDMDGGNRVADKTVPPTNQIALMFLATATGTKLEEIASGYGVTRLLAGKTEGNVTFHRIDTSAALIVPSETAVQSAQINGVTYGYATTAEAIFAIGVSTAIATVEADQIGNEYNLGTGYLSTLPYPVSGVTGVTNESDWMTSLGNQVEKDDALRWRARQKILSISNYHTDDVYRWLMSQATGLAEDREKLFFFDRAAQGAGSCDIYFLTDNGIPPQSLIDQATQYIVTGERYGLGDIIRIKAPVAKGITYNITYKLRLDATLTPSQIEDKIEEIIRYYHRENTAYSETDIERCTIQTPVTPSEMIGWFFEHIGSLKSIKFNSPADDVPIGFEYPTVASITVAKAA